MAEGKGAGRQGVIGRRLDSMSRLWAACVPWDPNLGTVTETFQLVGCGPGASPKTRKRLGGTSAVRFPILGTMEMGMGGGEDGSKGDGGGKAVKETHKEPRRCFYSEGCERRCCHRREG